MRATTVMREYVQCPHCGKGESAVGHITTKNTFGPWYCDDCGGAYRGTRLEDGSIDVTLVAERSIKTVDILVLPPQSSPVYFVVEGARYEGGRHRRQEGDGKAYYYEEHSCPTNWLEPVMVYHEGDADPHGLIRFVRTVDDSALPPDQSWGPNERDAAMVAMIEEAARTA